jgi:hypothetical protein
VRLHPGVGRLVNLPIGLLALAGVRAARRAMPADGGDRAARLDVPGLVLLAAGLGLATYGASRGPSLGWLSPGAALAWGGGLALVACYVLRDRLARGHRAPAPVSLSLLRAPARALTLALACVASVVLFAVLFLAPVFLQQIQHHGATVTGLGLLAASTLGLLLLTPATPLWLTTGLLCGRGAGLGFTVQPLVVALLDGLPRGAVPDANTLFNMAERLSGSFGIALLATFYAGPAAATGSPVAALHDCALVLTAAAAMGAVAAACNHGVSVKDAGFAQGGRHGRRHHSAAASQRADQAVPTGER